MVYWQYSFSNFYSIQFPIVLLHLTEIEKKCSKIVREKTNSEKVVSNPIIRNYVL